MGAPRVFRTGSGLPNSYFVYEQVTGTLLACPWSWLAPVAILMAARRARVGGSVPTSAWAVTVAAVGAVVALLPAMTVASAAGTATWATQSGK